MFSFLSNVFQKTTQLHVASDEVIYAVGDVHGCNHLLENLLEQIEKNICDCPRHKETSIIFLGDYIDRGQDSAAVLSTLADYKAPAGVNLIFLKGNHEASILDFIDDPINASRWLKFGGLQTLQSFGIKIIQADAKDDDLIDCAQALITALGNKRANFLRHRLQRYYQSGNILFVHAAANPNVAVESQTDRSLFWGSERFMKEGGPKPLWVVHGHTITNEPEYLPRIARLGIDTGAYISGKLTAVRIDKEGHSFLQT